MALQGETRGVFLGSYGGLWATFANQAIDLVGLLVDGTDGASGLGACLGSRG